MLQPILLTVIIPIPTKHDLHSLLPPCPSFKPQRLELPTQLRSGYFIGIKRTPFVRTWLLIATRPHQHSLEVVGHGAVIEGDLTGDAAAGRWGLDGGF
jgi:hypothetical protein